ncbi:MAG: ABC transporter [endosymbiont of Seepiophila jonesi]|uniref:ABC transporter n=1 Tax=endosymbiont of Lamellibrachia luymesi TaxID=2200907 RepID=A0A370DWY2_9GAMM|nr:MAG: ABC transporter [endosymbiont of Lamellibrachia luymesi]RDH94204.1 MAG: ABC transporter [endosymbiont of Seepiophila jonesi]
MSLLRGTALSLTFENQPILDAVDIELDRGEMLGLIGPNGAGKSSLLRCLAGSVRTDSGVLQLGQQRFEDILRNERARRIAYLPQQTEVHWPLSVKRIIELGRIPHLEPWGKLSERDQQVIERIITDADLQLFRLRPFDTLSGGERARVLLARALAAEPEILLADEPVAALDPAHQLDVMEMLAEHCSQGNAVIVVLHDLRLAAHFCQRLQLLHQGRTLAYGKPGEVLTSDNLENAYQIHLPDTQSAIDTLLNITWSRIKK